MSDMSFAEMKESFDKGERVFFAKSRDDYESFTDWLEDFGWRFSFCFETGEVFRRESGQGLGHRIEAIEVYGL